jgi:hypothetical protein
VLDIPYVEIEPLGPTERVSSRHLGEAGDSGTNTMAAPVIVGVQWKVLNEQRPWSNEAHVASQHVDQLRQLVDRRRSEPSAERCETMLVRQESPVDITVIGHRAKFDQGERPIVEPGTELTEKHRAADPNAHQASDDQQQRHPEWAREDDERQIEQALSGVRLHL